MVLSIAILAFDLGGVIFLAFLAISFISWIINQVNAQKRPQQGAPRQPRPPARARNDRIQQEIDQFLQEAAGRRRRPDDVLTADEIEIVQAPAAGRRPPRRPPQKPARTVRTIAPAPAPPAPPRRPGEDLASRRLVGQQQLGGGVSEHVRTRMDERVGAQVEQHLAHSVDQSVRKHLGAFSAETSSATGQQGQAATRRSEPTLATSMLAALRTRRGVQQAIIMQEVLQRPRALRR